LHRYSGNSFPDTYSLIHQDTGYYDKFKQLQGIVLKCFADCDRFSHVFSIKALMGVIHEAAPGSLKEKDDAMMQMALRYRITDDSPQ